MSQRRTTLGVLVVVLVVAACGRSRTPFPQPVISPPVVLNPDSAKAPPDSQPMIPVFLPGADSAARAAARKPEKQAQRCTLDFENTPMTRSQSVRDPISGKYTHYVGGGVVGMCKTQFLRIVADSLESYEQNRLHYLIGHVKYREDRVALDSDRLTYFQGEERLVAEGNVVVTMKDSSSMTGPRAEYWRAVRGVRPASRVHATARPTLRMYETDSTGRRQRDPVLLIADNIVGEGETLFIANGNVQLDRSDLKAHGDSAILDNVRQFSRLMKQPVVESKGSQPFTLNGRVIDIFGRTRKIDRVLAVDSAKAVNADLTLTAQTLDLRVIDNKLQRAYAHGLGRALAVTKGRTISAESLDVRMPNQRIQALHAARQAYAESDPDSAKVSSKERDWLRGDVIEARFDSSARDTTTQPPIIDLVAEGGARSFYHVPSNKGEKDRPGINYVVGRKITVDFKDRVVSTVTVDDSVSGVFLEAAAIDTLPPDGKTTKKAPAKRPTNPSRPPTRRRGPGALDD